MYIFEFIYEQVDPPKTSMELSKNTC